MNFADEHSARLANALFHASACIFSTCLSIIISVYFKYGLTKRIPFTIQSHKLNNTVENQFQNIHVDKYMQKLNI